MNIFESCQSTLLEFVFRYIIKHMHIHVSVFVSARLNMCVCSLFLEGCLEKDCMSVRTTNTDYRYQLTCVWCRQTRQVMPGSHEDPTQENSSSSSCHHRPRHWQEFLTVPWRPTLTARTWMSCDDVMRVLFRLPVAVPVNSWRRAQAVGTGAEGRGQREAQEERRQKEPMGHCASLSLSWRLYGWHGRRACMCLYQVTASSTISSSQRISLTVVIFM